MTARAEGASPASGLVARVHLHDAPLRGRTGRGVLVAVVDSGARAPHPHLPGVSGGARVFVDATGADVMIAEGDFVDTLGHGTAVASAIHEKAPDAEILAVKVFGDRLATSAPVLAHAIDYATRRGARLVNLSLGSGSDHPELRDAVGRAVEAGVIIVSALGREGRPCYPAALGDAVVAVRADAACTREEVHVLVEDGRRLLGASPYPRPIPGVPSGRNLSGVSFAVANAAGILARLLEAERPAGAREALERITEAEAPLGRGEP